MNWALKKFKKIVPNITKKSLAIKKKKQTKKGKKPSKDYSLRTWSRNCPFVDHF